MDNQEQENAFVTFHSELLFKPDAITHYCSVVKPGSEEPVGDIKSISIDWNPANCPIATALVEVYPDRRKDTTKCAFYNVTQIQDGCFHLIFDRTE